MATAPTLAVNITAIDGVTATINKINARMQAFAAPMEKLGKSVSRFGDVSGLTRMGNAFGTIAHKATNAFQSVGQIVAPLGAISGAASIAGMYRMVSAWSEWGTHLGNAATRIGISAQALSGFQGAARLAGVSSDTMTAGLQGLGQTMFDMVGGRAPEAVAMFNTLGISFRDASGHARGVAQALPELADKIASIHDPYVQARIATTAFQGAGEAMLPFLRRGAAGLREYTIMAQRYGVGNAGAVGAANQFREAQTRVALAVEGLSNSVAIQLAPVITPLLGQMAEWIAVNRDWIATGIGQEVRKFAGWVQGINWSDVAGGIHRFADGAQAVVDKVGGWQPAIELFLGFMAARWALGVLSPFASLTTSILGVSAKLGLLAGEGIATAIARFGLLGAAATAAGEKSVAAMSAGRAFASGAGLAVAGYAGNALVDHYDPTDRAGSWIDQHVPGASWVDNQASRIGLGRSYAQQQEALGVQQQAHVRPTSAQSEAIYKDAWGYMKNTGTPSALAAAILGSMRKESGGDAAAVGDHGSAYGALQWHGDRQALFQQAMGHDIHGSSLHEQLDFAKWELTHNEAGSAGRGYNGTGESLNSAVRANAFQLAGMAYSKNVIRPGLTPEVQMAEARERGAYAQDFATRYGGMAPPVPAPVAVASAPDRQITSQAPSVSPAGMQAAGITSRVSIDINGRLPPGFTATARGGDNVDLGGGLVQQSRLGMVAG